MNLFDSDYDHEPPGKLPSFLQYCKDNKGKKRPKSFHIAIIWFPNKFPSYCIETEKFRLTVSASSLMGKAIEANIGDIELLDTSIHLQIEDSKDGLRVYSFSPGSTEGIYRPIGDDMPIGLRFRPDHPRTALH